MKNLILLFILFGCAKFYSQIGLHFDNSDDMIQTSFVGILGNNPITVEAWIKADEASGESVITAWGSEAVNGARFTFRVNQLSATTDVIRIENKGGGVNGTIDVSDGSWHHVAVSYDPSQASNKYRLFVDGVLDVAGDIATPLNVLQSVNLRIGRRIHPTYTGYFGGVIDEVRVWNVTRTEAEILANKNAEFCQIPSNLVAYYKLNEGVVNGNNLAITSIIDEVAANNGNLIGFNQNGIGSNWIYGSNFLGPPNNYIIQNFNECDGFSISVNGNIYSTSGNYIDTMTNLLGCDSIIETQLTIAAPVHGIDVQYACESFQWIDGNTYFTSIDTPTFTLTGAAANGCDSIVTLQLTVNQPSLGIDQQISCGPFTWLDGNVYVNSIDTATFTIAGAASNGCDSIVTLNLIVNEVNAQITQNQDTLIAVNPNGAYQWVDCATLLPISGATSQIYLPTMTGDYAVIVTQNNCSDTSVCINFSDLGLEVEALDFDVFPNPVSEALTIKTSVYGEVTLIDLLGRVYFNFNASGMIVINTQALANGTYELIFKSNTASILKMIQINH